MTSLSVAGGGLLLGALPAIAGRKFDRAVARRVRPVEVDESLVVKEIAGLRPYRREGFVVRVERLDDRTVVHNYGHGGGGVTLSWGTAHLAADLACDVDAEECAVLGCGAVGLASARLMQRRGKRVTVYARDLPPNTTSNVAGGQWSPFSVYDPGDASPEFVAQFEHASRLSYDYYRELVGSRYAVRWRENYWVGDRPIPLPTFFDSLAGLYPDLTEVSPADHPFPRRYAVRFSAMQVDPAIYLARMLKEFRRAGGTVETREFRRRSELARLPEKVTINCTGLGSHELFDDERLGPLKGQLTVLRPQKNVRYNMIANGGLYMMPRSDGVLLGGSWDRSWDLEPSPDVSRRVLTGHRRIFSAFREGSDA